MITPPTTLHDRLRAELDRRLAVARAAASQYGPCWQITPIPPYTDPILLVGDGGDELLSAGTVDLHEAHQVHIALHDPADAVRRYVGGMLDEAEQRGYRRAMAEVTARGDNSETCRVEGCNQTECPGRQQPEAAA